MILGVTLVPSPVVDRVKRVAIDVEKTRWGNRQPSSRDRIRVGRYRQGPCNRRGGISIGKVEAQ